MNASNEHEIVPTTEELLSRTSSWTLACDNLLLNKLKKFSQDLEQTSLALTEDCENLSRDATVLEAKLHNVTNQFLALSSNQFVENRVQDFQEAASAVSSNSNTETRSIKKTKAEKEAELITKMKKSIQIGISANSQHVQSLKQDSEQPKPSAFPHLIGSSKFFGSRYVGLVQDERRVPSRNAPPNYQSSDKTSLVVEPSNHSIAESLPSSETSINPNDAHIPVEKSLPHTDISSASSRISENVPKNISSNTNSVHQPSRNQSVITPPTYSNEVHTALRQPNPTTSAQKQKQEDNYFNDDGPPPIPVVDSEDSDDDDFKPIVGHGGGGRIFADDDDDDDIFNDSSLFPPTRVQNSFFNTPTTIENITPAIRASPPPHPDEDVVVDNNDIFTSTKTNTKEQSKKVGPPPIIQDKIADSAKSVYRSDDKSQKDGTEVKVGVADSDSKKKSKIPPGGVSIFGSVPPTEIPKLRTQQNTKEQPTSKSEVVVDEPETQLPKASCANVKCVNVSDRGSSVGTNEDPETTSHSSLTSRGLNSSQGSLNDPIVPVSRPQPKGIFNDDSSDDDLFSSRKPQPSSSSIQPSRKSKIKDSLTVGPPQSSSTRNNQSKSKIKRSIFDDSDSDDDLFSSSSSTSSKITQQKTKQPLVFPIHEETVSHSAVPGVTKNRGGRSLFDNDSEDSDSDLFSTKGLNLNKSKSKTSTTNVIATSQTQPHNNLLIKEKEPEVLDKTNILKVSSKGSNSKSVIARTGRDSAGSGIKMQSEEKEEADKATASLDQATNSYLPEQVVTESQSPVMSPLAPEETTSANSLDNSSNPPVEQNNSGSEIHSSSDKVFTELKDDMKPPVVPEPDAADGVFESDVPDNKSAVSVKQIIAAVPGSKISQLKERLSASEIKVSPSTKSKPASTSDDTLNDVKDNQITKLKKKLSSPTDSTFSPETVKDDKGGTEKTGSKISKLKEKLSSESKPSATDEGGASAKLSGISSRHKVDVKKLALGLNINPLAMMPGAKLAKQGSAESPLSETEVLPGENVVDKTPDSPTSISVPSSASEKSKAKGSKKLASGLGLNINPLAMIPGAKPEKRKSEESPPPSEQALPENEVASPDSPRTPLASPGEVSVKKLALDLKINPLAMMPGAKPTKQKSLESPTTSATENIVTPGSPLILSTPPTEVNVENQEVSSPVNEPSNSTLETPAPSSPVEEGSPDNVKPLLPNLSKGRAKIQFKRKPPSKKLLHSCINSNAVAESPQDDTKAEDKATPVILDNVLKEDKGSIDVDSPVLESPATTDSMGDGDQNEERRLLLLPDVKESAISQEPHVKEKQITEDTTEVKHKSGPKDTDLQNTVVEERDAKDDMKDEKPNPSNSKSILAASIWDDSDSDDIFASATSKRLQSERKKSKEKDKSVLVVDLPRTEVQEKIIPAESNHIEEMKQSSPPKVSDADLQDPLKTETQHTKDLLFSDDDVIFKTSSVSTTNDGERSQNKARDKSMSPPPPPISKSSEGKIRSVASKKQDKNQGLFGSDSDSDDLFKSSKHSKTKTLPKKDHSTTAINAKPTEIGSSSTTKSKANVPKKTIFDDSSDEDLFAPKSKKKTVP